MHRQGDGKRYKSERVLASAVIQSSGKLISHSTHNTFVVSMPVEKVSSSSNLYLRGSFLFLPVTPCLSARSSRTSSLRSSIPRSSSPIFDQQSRQRIRSRSLRSPRKQRTPGLGFGLVYPTIRTNFTRTKHLPDFLYTR